jgi:hypothetical protein
MVHPHLRSVKDDATQRWRLRREVEQSRQLQMILGPRSRIHFVPIVGESHLERETRITVDCPNVDEADGRRNDVRTHAAPEGKG